VSPVGLNQTLKQKRANQILELTYEKEFIMTKPIILAIHGMGTHKPGDISKEIASGLKECASFFNVETLDIDSEFEIREFNYSDYFDEVRQKWANYAETIASSIGEGPSLVSKITALQSKLGNDDFLYTHWLDVITYCLFGPLRETVLSKAVDMLMTTMKEAKDDPENIRPVILLGHSLGTSVLHDAITKLYLRPEEPDSDNKLRFTTYPVDGLWTVANVSRLTHLITKLEDPNSSIARDNNSKSSGMSYAFYPCYNQYDPFTVFKRFALDPHYGDLIRTNEIRKLETDGFPFNPHSLVEYFADPEIGGVFLSKYSSLSFTTNEMQEAKSNYKFTTISGPISSALQDVKKAIREVEQQAGNMASLRTLVVKSVELYELIKEFYDILKNNNAKGAQNVN